MTVEARSAQPRQIAHPCHAQSALPPRPRPDKGEDAVPPDRSLGRRTFSESRKACRKKSASKACWPTFRSSSAIRRRARLRASGRTAGTALSAAARRPCARPPATSALPFMGRPGHAEFLIRLEAVSQRVAGVRRFGSAALDLAYVAAGRFDGYWETNLQPWDMAAGLLLVREAGGLVGALTNCGDPLVTGDILASNAYLYEAMKDLLEISGGRA